MASYRTVSHRPTIEVRMVATSHLGRLLGREVRTNMLVDSGADYTMMDESYAQQLGIDLNQCPDGPAMGIGGVVPGKRAMVKMYLCERWLNVPVTFSPGVQPQLLGRAGVFDNLLLGFAHSMSTFLARTM